MPIIDVLFVAFFAFGLVVVLNREALIPYHFSFDGDQIRDIALGRRDSYGDEKFEIVAAFYAATGLAHSPIVASIFGYLAGVLVTAIVWRRARRTAMGLAWCVPLLASIPLAAIYLGYYSKDVFVLGFPLILLYIRDSRRREFALVGAMLAYGLFFRDYWLLIAFAYFALRILHTARASIIGAMAGLASVSIALSMSIYVFLGLDPNHFREYVNASRVGIEYANTAIPSFFAGPQPLSGMVNNLITTAQLTVPLSLAAVGGIFYFAVALALFLLWATVFVKWRRARTALIHRNDWTPFTQGLSLLLAFLLVQGTFEPDYGSALRHLAPLVPLMAAVIADNMRANNASTSTATPVIGEQEVKR